jgi:hypothetical protein
MKYSMRCCALLVALSLGRTVTAQAKETASQPVIVSARIVRGSLIYKVNGKRVEDSIRNSLLTNLGAIVAARGNELPVLIIIDVHAPFSEVGKLETALDKADLKHYRLFVTDFSDGVMNEVHWDETGIPIPTPN